MKVNLKVIADEIVDRLKEDWCDLDYQERCDKVLAKLEVVYAYGVLEYIKKQEALAKLTPEEKELLDL